MRGVVLVRGGEYYELGDVTVVLLQGKTLLIVGSPPVTPPAPPPDIPPPAIPGKVNQVTYVYERESTTVPRQVSAAIQKLNVPGSGIVATEFDQNTVTGDGKVPKQYEVALKAALEFGLPCLVVQSGEKVLRVIKAPTTEREVMEAVK